jgi:hypothetical protein
MAAPIPIPAFTPVDNPADVTTIGAVELVAAAALVVGDVEGVADPRVEVVVAKSASFQRIETPYAFNPPTSDGGTAIVVVLVPFIFVIVRLGPGNFEPSTVHASVPY